MIARSRSRRRLAFDEDAFAPVVSLHRTVHGETHLLHAWNLCQVRVQLPVKRFQLAGRVACHLRIDMGEKRFVVTKPKSWCCILLRLRASNPAAQSRTTERAA